MPHPTWSCHGGKFPGTPGSTWLLSLSRLPERPHRSCSRNLEIFALHPILRSWDRLWVQSQAMPPQCPSPAPKWVEHPAALEGRGGSAFLSESRFPTALKGAPRNARSLVHSLQPQGSHVTRHSLLAHIQICMRVHTHPQPTHTYTHGFFTASGHPGLSNVHTMLHSPQISPNPLKCTEGQSCHHREKPPVGRKPLELLKDQAALPFTLLSELGVSKLQRHGGSSPLGPGTPPCQICFSLGPRAHTAVRLPPFSTKVHLSPVGILEPGPLPRMLLDLQRPAATNEQPPCLAPSPGAEGGVDDTGDTPPPAPHHILTTNHRFPTQPLQAAPHLGSSSLSRFSLERNVLALKASAMWLLTQEPDEV